MMRIPSSLLVYLGDKIKNDYVKFLFVLSFFMLPLMETYIYDAGLLSEGHYGISLQSGQADIHIKAYQADIPPDILEEYTVCEAEYDCDSSEIKRAALLIDRSCESTSLKEWITCAVDYLNEKIEYDRAGGNAQCGEKASEVLISGTGNCVDYSTAFVALCRLKGIPAYTGAVCLTNTGTVGCDLYQTIRPMEYTKLGGLPQPRGHAIALVYFNGEWTTVDPTFEYGLTRRCYGYSPVLATGEHQQVCKLPYYKTLPYI